VKKSWIIGAIALVLVLGGGIGWTVLRPSDEAKIRKVLDRLVHAVEPRPNANPIFEMGRVKGEFGELLTERVEVSIPDIGGVPSSRNELAQAAVAAGSRFGVGDLELSVSEIKLDDAHTRADVDSIVRMKRQGSAFSREERRVHFSLRNDDGWRVTSINVSAASGR
jgi:hypothetical protein